MLFVDGGEDRIGIGTGTPAAKVHIVTSGEDQLRIADGTRAAALGSTGSINFVGSITAAQVLLFTAQTKSGCALSLMDDS